MAAIKVGGRVGFALTPDDGYGAYRLQVQFEHSDGRDYIYESKPFLGRDLQILAGETAVRIERLGVSRSLVRAIITPMFQPGAVDFEAIFEPVKKPTTEVKTIRLADAPAGLPQHLLDAARRDIETSGVHEVRQGSRVVLRVVA